MTITGDSPTHASARISEFILSEQLVNRHSPARFDIYRIWPIIAEAGVDPSFALAQFWAESLYGTAGWSTITGSWGNILFPNTTIAESHEYHASNGFHYAAYDNWVDSVRDYVGLLGKYRDIQTPVTGDTSKIYWATAKWIGKVPGSAFHLEYLGVVLWRIKQYDSARPKAGDRMIFAGESGINTTTRYALKHGTPLYEAPGLPAYASYQGADTSVRWLGRSNNTTFGAIVINTSHGSPSGTQADLVVYVGSVKDSQIT